jgi:hypothetical protein
MSASIFFSDDSLWDLSLNVVIIIAIIVIDCIG